MDLPESDLLIEPAPRRTDRGPGMTTGEVDSSVRVTHLPTGCSVTCNTERSQLQNKAIAVKYLTAMVTGREV